MEEIVKRFDRAKRYRQQWEQWWEECYEYTQPQRPSFYHQEAAQRRDEKIYDSSPVVYTQEFANRMQAGLATGRWATLSPGPELEEDDDLLAELQDVNKRIFEVIADSNFDTELNEILQDCSVSHGSMMVQPGTDTVIECTAFPIPMIYFDTGPDGKVDTVFRQQKLSLRDIGLLWPKGVLPMSLQGQQDHDKEYEVVDVVYRDWSKTGSHVYQYLVWCMADRKHTVFQNTLRGRGANPWITPRWSKASGERYGRGPVFNSLGAIRTLNLTTQLVLENADMAVTGMWQAVHDGVLNPDTIHLAPGAVIPVGREGALAPLQPGNNFDVSQLVIRQMQESIRNALYADNLGTPEGTPMSATEVSARMAELARRVGAPLTRMWEELFKPFIFRTVWIMEKQGLLELPTIDGKRIKLVADSPLARALRNEDITATTNFIQLVAQMFGPEAVKVEFDQTEAVSYLAREYNINPKIRRSKRKQQELGQQAGEAAAQAANLGVDPLQAMQSLMP